MEIPARDPAQITFAPRQRDYSPMAEAGAAQQRFYQEAFRQAAGLTEKVVGTVQRTRLSQAQNDTREYLIENEEQYRQDLVNAYSGITDPSERSARIEEVNQAHKQNLEEIRDRLIAPGLRMRFNQWSENEMNNWRLGAELNAATQVRARAQYNTTQQITRKAATANAENIVSITQEIAADVAEAQAEGLYQPRDAARVLDEAEEMAVNSAYRGFVKKTFSTFGYDAAVRVLDGDLPEGMEGFEVGEQVTSRVRAEVESMRTRQLQREQKDVEDRVNGAKQELGEAFPAAYLGQGEAPTVYEIRNDPRLQGDDPYTMQTRQQLLNAAVEYENWIREKDANEAEASYEAEVARQQQGVRTALDEVFNDPVATPEEYRLAVASQWRQAGWTEAQRDARMNAAPNKVMSPAMSSYFEGISTYFTKAIRDATNEGDDEKAQRLTRLQEEADIRLYQVLSSGEYQSEQAREEAMGRVLQNMTNDALAEEVGKLDVTYPDDYARRSGSVDAESAPDYRRGRALDRTRLNDVEGLQRQIDEGGFEGRVEDARGQLEELLAGYVYEWNNMIDPDVEAVDARISDANGRGMIAYDAYDRSGPYPTPMVPEEFVRNYQMRDGSTRKVFMVSFKEMNNDLVPVAWSERQRRWVEVAGVPGFSSVIRR